MKREITLILTTNYCRYVEKVGHYVGIRHSAIIYFVFNLCGSLKDDEKLFELRESLERSEQMTHEMVSFILCLI